MAGKLTVLSIEPPVNLIEGVFLDQRFDADNRVVNHHLDLPPVILQTG